MKGTEKRFCRWREAQKLNTWWANAPTCPARPAARSGKGKHPPPAPTGKGRDAAGTFRGLVPSKKPPHSLQDVRLTTRRSHGSDRHGPNKKKSNKKGTLLLRCSGSVPRKGDVPKENGTGEPTETGDYFKMLEGCNCAGGWRASTQAGAPRTSPREALAPEGKEQRSWQRLQRERP